MLKLDFPKSLRQYPEGSARETYIYRVVRRGLPRVFYKEYEHSREAGRQVKFRFADLVMYFAQAAAQGVIGNLAYYAIAKAIKALRKPKQEAMGKGLRFEAVISRRTYNRLRREQHPHTGARRISTSEVDERLETEYRLMVSLVNKRGELQSIHDQDVGLRD